MNKYLFVVAALIFIFSLSSCRFSPSSELDSFQTDLLRQTHQNSITLETEKLSPSLLKVTVAAEGIRDPLIGLAFDFEFRSEALEFIEYRKGQFFERGGTPLYLSTLSKKTSMLVTGITLKRGDELQKGTGDVVYFYFNVLDSTLDPQFYFKNTVASTLENGKRKDLDGIEWNL